MMTLLLYPLLTTALYYLGSRALLTRAVWSAYPPWLDKFMLCAACTGAWLGAAAALGVGWYWELPFLGLPARHWATPVVVGLASIVWTPILVAVHLWALERTAAEPIEATEPVVNKPRSEEPNATSKG